MCVQMFMWDFFFFFFCMQIFKNAKMYKTEMEKSILVNSGGIHEEAENRIEKKLLLLKFLVSNCCKSTDICNEYKYV